MTKMRYGGATAKAICSAVPTVVYCETTLVLGGACGKGVVASVKLKRANATNAKTGETAHLPFLPPG